MVMQSKIFDKDTIATMSKMIGSNMLKIVHDEFTFTNSVYGVVSLFIGNCIFNLTNELETLNCYGENEEVSILRFNQVDETKVKSLLTDKKQIESKVSKTIKKIDIIIDHIHLEDKVDTYENCFVKGLIFYFDSDEIAFEKTDSFTEMIGVYKGYELITKFSDVNDIKAQFSNVKNIEVKREIMTLQ